VLVASNGEEALELSRSYGSPIDVLVTDVIMPGMGGGELSRRLRQERPGIKVLHVSGYTAGALRQHEALEDGAAFMQKPFTTKTLIARLREVMAGFIRRRNAQGHTFLVVSHDMPIVVDLCHRAACMNAGRLIASGSTREVLKETAVIEAYLGSGSHA